MKNNTKKQNLCPLCDAKMIQLNPKEDEIIILQLNNKSYKEAHAIVKQLSKYSNEMNRPILVANSGMDLSAISIDELIALKGKQSNA